MTTVPLWLTTDEAAEFLGVNPLTILRRMSRGELPAHDVDGVIKFKIADLVALVISTTGSYERRQTPAKVIGVMDSRPM